MGAWIETKIFRRSSICERVAPHVGAWIETDLGKAEVFAKIQSHPMWVRGLKLGSRGYSISNGSSHPMWVRGLKREQIAKVSEQVAVAPHVGAWIETSMPLS